MPPSSSHRADIQGLRALAVLLVVLAHAGVGFLPGGFVGVDVFFVLSGFLITGLLLAEVRATGTVSLIDFYVRRARRILPAAALTLLATDVAAFFLLNFLRAREAVHDSLYTAVFAANFRFAARSMDYFAQAEPPSPLLHYWSLAVEEQFYLVSPALLSIVTFGLALARRRRRAGRPRSRPLLLVVVVVSGISLGWSVHLTATVPAAAYFSPLTRAWELGLGCALAVGAATLIRVPPLARLVMGWGGLLAIMAAALLFSERTPFPGFAALLPTVGTALAIAAGIGDRQSRLAVARLLALRPLCIVGDRSYAFYLWHWPVLILADQYVGYELSVTVKLGLLMGAFLLSCVSYALVENPIRRRARSRKATGVVFGVSMAAVLGTAVLCLTAIARDEQRFNAPAASASLVTPAPAPVATPAPVLVSSRKPAASNQALPDVVAAVMAARRGDPIPSGLNPPIGRLRTSPPQYVLPDGCSSRGESSKSTSKICHLGDTTSQKTIVLVGDSHAMMWLPAVLELAWRDGWVVIPILRTGCRPDRWVTNEGPASCRAWYRWAIREVRLLHPRIALIGGSIGERPSTAVPAAADGTIAMARALDPYGAVVVIGDPEGLNEEPRDCLLSSHASMATCTTRWPPTTLRSYDRVAATMRRLGIGFIATRGFFCFERQCPAVIGNTIAYWDHSHITATYALQIAGAFRTAFLRAAARATP
jgi:peptidoglycan/LPS O-acetylase OafA/YrhL